MFDKRHRITLLFNANKAYDRQVVEGVGEYLQASQSEWDIFIEEDFRARIDNIKEWLGDGVIADYDDDDIAQLLADVDVPIVGVGGSYHLAENYPAVHYIATDNHALVESAFLHLKEKGVNRFAFYGLPASSRKHWAAKLLHRLLAREEMPLQRILVPPMRVIARRSTDYRSLTDPAVIQAMHFIRNHACKGIKVEQVLDAVGISRSNLEKRFKEEVGETIHAVIHAEKLEKARSLLVSTTLAINEISQMCGYPSLQYFYSVFKKEYDTTPKEYRDQHSEVLL